MQINMKNQLQEENRRNYKTKYSTKLNRQKFKTLRKARGYLRDGTLTQESYDLFVRCMFSNED